MLSEAYKEKLHQENLKRFKEILDPLHEDIKNNLVPYAYLKSKHNVSKEAVDKYLKLLYGIEVDWGHVDHKSKYYGIAAENSKKKKRRLTKPARINEDYLPIIDKKDFVKNFKLPSYIKTNLLTYGNTVIKNSTYIKLGATGVRYTIKRQFGLDTILEIVNERTCVVYTKGNRPYEGGYQG